MITPKVQKLAMKGSLMDAARLLQAESGTPMTLFQAMSAVKEWRQMRADKIGKKRNAR